MAYVIQHRGKTPTGGRAWRAVAMTACLLCGAASLGAAELLDRVLAVVSGTVITLSDARTAIAFGEVDTTGARDPIATAMRWLVDRQLAIEEVDRYGTNEVDEARVADGLAAITLRFGSAQAFAAALPRLGLDQTGARSWIRDSLRVAQYLARRFDAMFSATDEELREYFARHASQFARSGAAPAFDGVVEEVRTALQQDRRTLAVEAWLSRLRRRADVIEIYVPVR